MRLVVPTLLLYSTLIILGYCPESLLAQRRTDSTAVLTEALKQFQTQQGVHFTGSERNYNPFLNITVQGTVRGTYRKGGDVHFQAHDQFHSSEDEMFVLSGRTIRREPHTDRWNEDQRPGEALATVLPLSQNHVLSLPIIWMEAALAVPEQLGITESRLIGKTACWVVRLQTGADGHDAFSRALNKSLGGHPAGTVQRQSPKLHAEFWIARDSLLIQRLTIEIGSSTAGVPGSLSGSKKPVPEFSDTLSVDYHDYNQRLELKLPSQVTRLIERANRSAQNRATLANEEQARVGQSGASLLKDAADQSLRQGGYHFELDSRTLPLRQAFTADGVFVRNGFSTVRTHLVYNEMRARYYLKGDRIAMTVPAAGEQCFPFPVDDDLKKSHPHPRQLFLDSFVREPQVLGASMKHALPEKIEARWCHVVELRADTSTLVELGALLAWNPNTADGSWPDFPFTGLGVMRGMEGWSGPGASHQVRNLHWRIWIGVDDGLIYRLQRQVTTRVDITESKWKALGAPIREGKPYRGGDFLTTLELRIHDYNQDLEVDLPPFVLSCLR